MKKNILKIIAILLLLGGCLISCEKNNSKVCNVDNPLTDLPWLKEIISGNSGMYMNIFQCTYNNALNAFFVEPCVNCHDYVAVLYSCNGDILFNLEGTKDIKAYFEEWNIKDQKLIWTNIK
jgi:hypothetical protein